MLRAFQDRLRAEDDDDDDGDDDDVKMLFNWKGCSLPFLFSART
jgi:hypothetical protein|tara:strand:- start:36 stop:167 length:132 start_codon:yes stop_codon:yes gene_type:complete